MNKINTLTRQLYQLRKRLKMSQEEFAKEIGVARQTYNAIENNKTKVSKRTLDIIEEKFNVKLDLDHARPDFDLLLSTISILQQVGDISNTGEILNESAKEHLMNTLAKEIKDIFR